MAETAEKDEKNEEAGEAIKQEKDSTVKDKKNSEAEYALEEMTLIKQQNDELSSKNREYEDLVKRQQADFENFRRRTQKEKEDIARYASEKIINDLLEILDNFDRALSYSPEEDNAKTFVDGFKMINGQVKDLLQKHQVTEVDGEGFEFDPNLHQAIAFEESETVSKETITEVYQKGYKLHDKVIRVARVKVTKPASSEETVSDESANESTETDEN